MTRAPQTICFSLPQRKFLTYIQIGGRLSVVVAYFAWSQLPILYALLQCDNVIYLQHCLFVVF